MVPFHINQVDTNLFIDFGRTSIKPPVKQIIPLNLAEARTMELAADQKVATTTTPAITAGEPITMKPTPAKGEAKKGFNGEPMYLDFVNADVTHILRLINEVSEENIIWDPAIAGQKISMILKDVPWDEALELILQNNNLAKKYVGDNIIWITTKAKMRQIEAEERAEAERIRQQELDRIKKEQQKEEVEAPLITEYIPLDFARAGEVRPHIILTERGKISIDTRTNTIIINDTEESIKQAKETISQFDTPVKQIMIEARIVDATDDLTQSLGITWTATGSRTDADSSIGGSFVTNSPAGWVSNVGLTLAKINGLTSWGLDAVLALNEAEGKSKTLSAPKVIAREGTSANISAGDTLIIDATENVASTTIDATLSLTVTPTSVSYNDFITLDVVVTDDRAPSSDRILTKSISTTLMIKSGDTVVIGGIIKESDSENVDGIIGLKDLPIVGYLFRAKQSIFQRSELLIFLTPKVLPFSSDVY
jgi:type IV pilus assembly protein PilQ